MMKWAPYIPKFSELKLPAIRHIYSKLYAKRIASVQSMKASYYSHLLLGEERKMFETTVKREELIKYVRKNMQEHQAIVEEALVGYKKSVIKILEERLEEARQGKNIVQALSFPQPRSHLRDYERVLKMLEMDNKEMITLDETQFAQYVQDDWGWKRAFLSEHAQYSSRAMQFMSGSQEDE